MIIRMKHTQPTGSLTVTRNNLTLQMSHPNSNSATVYAAQYDTLKISLQSTNINIDFQQHMSPKSTSNFTD